MERSPLPAVMVIFILTSGCMADAPDLDGDGIQDSEDLDIDGDGWDNDMELNCSTDHLASTSVPSDIDGDLVCDFLDSDDDGDLWGDFTELDCSTDPRDNKSVPEDYDGDMICDTLDLDADGDGLPNEWEQARGLDYLDSEDYITCHGMSKYCLRTYDDFTFAESHNSFSTPEDGIIAGINHHTGLQSQWEDGIRAFMLDPYHPSELNNEKEDVVFCHALSLPNTPPCLFGSVDAFAWLRNLSSLHDNSSGDIVSLLIQNYRVPGEHLEYLLNETGILERAYIHELGSPWPSIGDMALSGTDVVIFIEMEYEDNFTKLLPAWKHTWDTPYGESSQDEMTCDLGRGDLGQPVWHMNNWLSTFGLSDANKASQVNSYDTLLERALLCWETVGNRPTFIGVDYWEQGEVTNVTRTLNEMSDWSDDLPPHPSSKI